MNGAIARIVLRYLVGGAIMGSTAIGDKLATDPDIVMAAAALVGFLVEGAYVIARKRGWKL